MTLIPRLKPYFNHREILAALMPSRGSIERFESEFAEKFECKYGLMFPYGRSGLYSLLKAWSLEGAEVICPAYTCVVVPHAIVMSGNTPVFVDCAEDSFNMSYDGIRKAITAKTRVIIATHLFGYPMDVYKVSDIAKEAEGKYGQRIYVIQDTAHSFGAKWQGEMVTKFGDAAIFGLNISKVISSIFGGMVTTNSADTYKKLSAYRQANFKKAGLGRTINRFVYLLCVYVAFNRHIYRFVNSLERKGALGKLTKYYDERRIDLPDDWDYFPCRIEARVGLVQLGKYELIIKKRIERAGRYIEEFRGRSDITVLPFTEGATYSHCVALVEDRERWLKDYFGRGVQLGRVIEYAVPYTPVYFKYRNGDYPVSEYYSGHIINFPNWPE